MDDISKSNNNSIQEEYVIHTKNRKDILNDMKFIDDSERELCNSIIEHIEKEVSENVRNMKAASIPQIGVIRINPVKRLLRDHHEALRIARQHMTKEEFKQYARDMVSDWAKTQEEIDKKKIIIRTIKQKFKKKYTALCKICGYAYAELWVYSLYLLDVVPFDEEWEEQYQELKNKTK